MGVSAADDPADVAANIAAAINAHADLPLAAAVDGETDEQVNLTARHKGLVGNTLDVRLNYYDGEALPAGLTVAITALAGGTANPDVAAVWPVLGDEQYTTMIVPYTDAANLAVVEEELLVRWGPLKQNDGVAWTAANGSHAALGTLGDSRNSQHLAIMNAHGSPSPVYDWAAAVAGVESYHTNIDPARPLQTLALRGVLPPARPGDRRGRALHRRG